MVVLFAGSGRRRNISNIAMDIFDNHQGTHILQVHYIASDDNTIWISITAGKNCGIQNLECTVHIIFWGKLFIRIPTHPYIDFELREKLYI